MICANFWHTLVQNLDKSSKKSVGCIHLDQAI